MRRWQAVVLALGLVCGLSAPFPVHAGETENKCFDRDYTFNFLAENDLWGSGSDKHFTHGTRLSLVESRKKRKEAGDCQPGDDFHFMDLVRTISDHTPPGWLGIVGPESYAEDIQKWWHQAVTDSPRPQGWAHQLKNELGLLLNLERKWWIPVTDAKYDGLQVDVLPSVGAALGNVYTYASAGGMVRLGVNLKADYGPPRIRPGAQGSDFFKYDKNSPVSWYVYAGVEGRAVAVNIFLDGNTFADSHSVDKKVFVGDIHTGFVLMMYRFRFSFSQVFRSNEFNGQKELDEFGSVSLSVAW